MHVQMNTFSKLLVACISLLLLSCSSSKQYGQPIGAEKPLALTQPGYKPKK